MQLDVLKRRSIVASAVAAIVVGGATVAGGVAVANNGDDEPLSGATYDQAVAAALAHTGGGTVTETEIGDGDAAYEVEVRLADGSQIEVQLDESFAVISSEADDDGPSDTEDDDD